MDDDDATATKHPDRLTESNDEQQSPHPGTLTESNDQLPPPKEGFLKKLNAQAAPRPSASNEIMTRSLRAEKGAREDCRASRRGTSILLLLDHECD